MSKKKNTLKDLDEFLKQQAATLVPPSNLSEKIEEPVPVVSTAAETSQADDAIIEEVSAEKIVRELTLLSTKEGDGFRTKLYDIIIQSLESGSTSAEDKMLINTALYLKSGNNWKEVIRNYWKGKK